MRVAAAMVLAMMAAVALATEPVSAPKPAIPIAIIIDDVGDRLRDGERVVNLPGQVTIGILPYTPFAIRLSELAKQKQKEVVLHLPMEALEDRYLGKGGLDSHMDKAKFMATLKQSLQAVPYIRGVNNHMGSRLTQDKQRMGWLMSGLYEHGNLYFLDSRTIDTSQAYDAAVQMGLAHATRDVFLDHNKSIASMEQQWQYFMKLANQQGSAIAIAHPYPSSIVFLQDKLEKLDTYGVKLMPISRLIEWRETRRKIVWQTPPSSSH